jgi:hypothetical protein
MSKRRGVTDKQRRLRELKQRMEEHFSKLWFFTDEGGRVDGYLGTEPVMFVGIRPSTGKGGLAPQALGYFYRLMIEYGFSQAHVTDVVKEQMETGLPSPEQVERNWPFFLEELRIVEPKHVVALGGWVFDTLRRRLDSPVPIRITHYSYRFCSRSKLEERLRADFERLKRILESADARDAQDDLIP